MVEHILDEFKMPVNGNNEVILRVIQGERVNILQIIMDDKIIPIQLIGYGANALFEVGNKFAIKYASLTELMPNFPPFTPHAQPLRQEARATYTPRSNSVSKSTSPIQFSKMITVDEAIAILKNKAPVPPERVKIKTTEAEMIDFIIKFKGGSEIYMKGDLKVIKEANLFIDYKLFKDTMDKLLADHIIAERHKISRTNHPYTVYIIPREVPGKKESVLTNTSKSGQTSIPNQPPSTETINLSAMSGQTRVEIQPHQKEEEKIAVPQQQQVPASLVSADTIKSSITDYLETLFYSFKDSELNLEIFLSEAQFQKIPIEVARDFYIKKLEERDKRLLRMQKMTSNTNNT